MSLPGSFSWLVGPSRLFLYRSAFPINALALPPRAAVASLALVSGIAKQSERAVLFALFYTSNWLWCWMARLAAVAAAAALAESGDGSSSSASQRHTEQQKQQLEERSLSTLNTA